MLYRKVVILLLLLISTSSCWHMMLMSEDIFHEVEELKVIPENFPSGTLDKKYYADVKFGFAHQAILAIESGQIPPGLTLELIEYDNETQYYLILSGTPTEKGVFKFTARVTCCYTMAGASQRSAREFKVEIN